VLQEWAWALLPPLLMSRDEAGVTAVAAACGLEPADLLGRQLPSLHAAAASYLQDAHRAQAAQACTYALLCCGLLCRAVLCFGVVQ
jgi:hypothetical protein